MKDKNKNMWMMRFTNELTTNMLDSLSDDDNISIILTTTNFKTLERHKKITKRYGGISYNNNSIIDTSYLQEFNKSNKLKNKKYNLFESVSSRHLYISLQVLERNMRYKNELSFEEKNLLLHYQLNFWIKQLDLYPPDAVLFIDTPHFYYEILLVGLLKKRSIPLFNIINAQGSSYYFADADFKPLVYPNSKTYSESFKENIELAATKNKVRKPVASEKEVFSYIRYMVTPFKLLIRSLIYFLIFPNKEYVDSLFIKKKYMRFGKNKHFNELYFQAKYMASCLFAKIKYNFIAINKIPNKPFAFLGLSSGFENTMHPGMSPLNWHLIVKKTLESLPPGTDLLIKEHPQQFKFRFHQPFSRYRGFYDSIKSLDPRIKFVKTDIFTLDLINRSELVFAPAASGIFLEAYALKKNIIPFGPSLINGSKDMNIVNYNNSKELKYFTNSSIFPWFPSDAKKTMKSIIKQLMYHLD